MTVTALWIPFEVADAAGFDASARFYQDLLGLTEVAGWQRDGERGAVYAAGETGRIEIVWPAGGPGRAAAPKERLGRAAPPGGRTSSPPRPPIAFELPDRAAVDELYSRLHAGRPAATSPGKPATFPRGHYGFSTADPSGYPVLLWTEAAQ